MKYILTILFFTIIKVNAQEWKVINFSNIDTSTIEILYQKLAYGNGNVKQTGSFRHIKLKYEQIAENYSPIGRQIYYSRNGKTKRIQNYNDAGFLLSDTLYRRSGRMKENKIFKTELSVLESDGTSLYFVDRFYTDTFYFRNGNMDCQGPAESTRSVFLIRRDTWQYYKKDGTLKYQLKYEDGNPGSL